MKIVFLDVKTIGEDIDLSAFDTLGEVVKYPFSTPEESLERTKDADVIVLNKVEINEKSIGKAENLKLVCVTATGTNNLDKEYLAEKGIEWRNVAGYSTESVAQHTFALLFYLLEKMRYYDEYVKCRGGFYLDFNSEMPGPVAYTQQQLEDCIKEISVNGDVYTDKLIEFNKKYSTMNDGGSAKRIVDELQNGGFEK